MRENRFSRRAGLLLPNLALVSLLVTGAARGAEDKVPDPEAPGLTLAARFLPLSLCRAAALAGVFLAALFLDRTGDLSTALEPGSTFPDLLLPEP